MPEKIRIAVVDDHQLLREGVVHVLAGDGAFEVVGQGASAEDAVRLAESELPDLILLDVSMPGGGVAAADAISKTWPVVKSVMLTVSEDQNNVVAALKAGAKGYILKGIGGTELCAAIKKISAGESYVSPALAAQILADQKQVKKDREPSAAESFDLTYREEQILDLVSKGLSNREVGDRLGIKEKTVKHYMTNVLQKLQVRNRVEAALLARRR